MDTMILQGSINKAKIFTHNIEENTIGQIIGMLNEPITKNTTVAIMPDVHYGKGSTVGTTIKLPDNRKDWKVCPNVVGIDIGCSMRAIRLDITDVDLERLDDVVTKEIITGRKHLSKPLCNVKEIKALLSKLSFKLTNEQISQAIHSCGTLGGGNHYVELGKSQDQQYWLTVHSGSRTLGIVVAAHHSNIALTQNSDVKNKNFSYLEGDLLQDYLNDLDIAQKFSTISRKIMLYKIAEKMNWKIIDEFESMHNYIDLEQGIIRKGATSAQSGERLIIPLNMRDGSIFATGKGNPEWNFSAPHGAGRKLSRGVAKNFISLDEYRETMKGIYSTSITQSTLDESPFAYKESQEIIDAIADTVTIDMLVKPIYNFKAH